MHHQFTCYFTCYSRKNNFWLASYNARSTTEQKVEIFFRSLYLHKS